jgi:hypothetical protein
LSTGTTEAGEKAGQSPTAAAQTNTITGQIADFDRQITLEQGKRQAAIDAAKAKVPKSRIVGRDANGNRTISYSTDPQALDQAANQAAAPFDTNIAGWQQQKAALVKRMAPFSETAPEWEQQLIANLPWLSVLSGAFTGRGAGMLASKIPGGVPGKIPLGIKAAAYGASALGGGLEGYLSESWPVTSDLKLPEGSPAQEEAKTRWNDPDYWKYQVAPEVAKATALSMLGAYYAMKPSGTFKSFYRGFPPNPPKPGGGPMMLSDFGGPMMMPVPRDMPNLVRPADVPVQSAPAGKIPAPAAEEIPVPHSTEISEPPPAPDSGPWGIPEGDAVRLRPEDYYGGGQTIADRLRNGPWPEWPEPGEDWRAGSQRPSKANARTRNK